MDQGVEVLGIGLCGTEEMYWATMEFDACGGIEVTASHNPINYNGLKMVKSQSRPLDPATELLDIKALAEKNVFEISAQLGHLTDMHAVAKRAYVTKVLSFVDLGALRPMSIVVNSGNGAAGPSFDEIERYLSAQTSAVKFHRMFHEPDSSFPNGIPNPLLKKIMRRPVTWFCLLARILVWLLMAILTGVSSLMSLGNLFRANILLVC